MSETAAERGRRFAERWEGMAEAAPGLSAWFASEEHKHTNTEAAKVVRLRGKACATRARWLRHAAMVVEERERERERWVLVALAAAVANVSAAMDEVRALEEKRRDIVAQSAEHVLLGVMPSETVLTARQRRAVEPAHWPVVSNGEQRYVTVEMPGKPAGTANDGTDDE